MIDPLQVFEELSRGLDEKTARFLSETLARMYEELSATPTKAELAAAQARTEARLGALDDRMAELAAAEARTDAGLATLEERMAELAAAEVRTEARLATLEERMAELAEAQRETERSLQRLDQRFVGMIEEFSDLRRQVGGLSDAVSYGLENSIFPYLRSFAKREFEIDLRHFDRRNVEYPDGRFDEVNIYAEGRKEGGEVILMGEAKAQPSKRDVDAFANRVDRIRNYVHRPVYSFFVGHTFSPEVERYFAQQHPEIRPVKSYVFEVSYTRETPGETTGSG